MSSKLASAVKPSSRARLASTRSAQPPTMRATSSSGWRLMRAATLGPATRASASICSPTVQDTPGIKEFVAAYRAHYGLMPTQRSFFVYEATLLVVDAIRRAGSDQPAAIHQALKTTTMPSMLGGSYAPDDHNHAHTPLQILGLRAGRPAVIATE